MEWGGGKEGWTKKLHGIFRTFMTGNLLKNIFTNILKRCCFVNFHLMYDWYS